MKTAKVNKALLSLSLFSRLHIVEEHVFFCLRDLICKIRTAAEAYAEGTNGTVVLSALGLQKNVREGGGGTNRIFKCFVGGSGVFVCFPE